MPKEARNPIVEGTNPPGWNSKRNSSINALIQFFGIRISALGLIVANITETK
jgi:hypothetical protein